VTLQRRYQIRHFITTYIQSPQGDNATGLAEFALAGCSCYLCVTDTDKLQRQGVSVVPESLCKAESSGQVNDYGDVRL